MKRLIAMVVVCALSVALFGCGKKDSGSAEVRDDNSDKPKATAAEAEEASDDTGIEFKQSGGKIVFKVDPDVELTQNAWLGFCPGTKGYVKEIDADEVDVVYAYIENDERKASDDYEFKFENELIEGLEDGDYTVVLCDDDDEGKVVLYFPAVVSGSKVSCDFNKIVINK